MRRILSASCLILLASCASNAELAAPSTPVAQRSLAPAAAQWRDDLRSIADGSDNTQRREAIGQRLDAQGIAWRKVAFDANGKRGENLMADVSGPADAPLLLIGAHSDRVPAGRGATDNASGSATVLALAQRLRAQPLQHHRVAIAFWDLEEEGLLGSKSFVNDGATRPALYVNFDVFGWGDTLWMMAPVNAQGALVQASQNAAEQHGIGFSAGEHYPPTDHLPFVRAGWPAVSYSLVGGEEIMQVLDAYAGKKSNTPPKVMRVIHSPADTLEQVDATAAARGVDAIEQALRRWDAEAQASATTVSGSGQ